MRKVLQLRIVPLGLLALLTLVTVTTPLATMQAQGGSPLPLDQIKVTAQVFSQGFKEPTFVANAGDGSNLIYVVEKVGRIQIVRDGATLPQPFLDITSLVDSSQSERGLLSVAFHPNYKTNGLFYVYYTGQGGTVTIAQYKVSANPSVADPN